jgi:hypothetical protein
MARRISLLPLLCACALLLALLPPARPAHGAITVTVDSELDEPDESLADNLCSSTPSTRCTLRAAVMQLVASGGGTINLPAGTYLLDRIGTDNTSINGDLDFNLGAKQTFAINGAGSGRTTIDGGGFTGINDRIIDINTGTTGTISGVTIRGGRAAVGFVGHSHGGGLHNHGALTLEDVRVLDNAVPEPGWGGGGITNAGGATATLARVVIADNRTDPTPLPGGIVFGMGGGIENLGTLVAEDTALERNSSFGGGGLWNTAAATLRRATFEANEASLNGGGIFNQQPAAGTATLTLINGTLSGNATDEGPSPGLHNSGGALTLNTVTIADHAGAGLYYGNGTANVSNTIVDGNCFVSGGGFVSLGFNLGANKSCPFGNAQDLPPQDPELGPLADNGGFVKTHALEEDSPAVDAGSPAAVKTGGAACAAVDARGAARPFDGDDDGTARCDVGAFELAPTFTLKVKAKGRSGTISGPGINCRTGRRPGDCSESYPAGTSVTLTTEPQEGTASFVGWKGACVSAGASSSCTLTIDANKNAKGKFKKL